MSGHARRSAAMVALSLLVAGCAVGPNYKRPLVPVPQHFYGDAQAAADQARSLADVPWWDVFDDPILKALIEESVRNGFDARLAAARVQEARARYGIARSQFLPSVDYEGAWQRARADQFLNPAGKAQTRWTVDVGFSWELDLWGRIRRLNEAARAEYLATEEGRRGVLLSLVSDVAVAYLELRELDDELEIAKHTTAAFQDTYDLFNRRLEGGAASALETSRAEGSLGQVAAEIPEIERAVVARENQINFLLGRNPQPIPREGPLMSVPPDIPPGLPSALLERRPDIREAEQHLVAANASVGVAKADFFPRLSLTGAGRPVLQGQDLEHRLLSPGPDLPGRTDQAKLRGGAGAVAAGTDLLRGDHDQRLRRGLTGAGGPDEARRDRAPAGAGGGRVPGGRAARQRPIQLGALGVLRGAGGPATALSRRNQPGPDAPRPARGRGEPLPRAGRGMAGGGTCARRRT